MRDERFLTVGAQRVSALFERPEGADTLAVLAHGAGAGMAHPFLEQLSAALHRARIATLRYQCPYMQAAKRRPDPRPLLLDTVRAAIASGEAVGLRIVAGGKSMGGRMTSLALSERAAPCVRGVFFVGFPLQPAPRAGQSTPAPEGPFPRADHLANVGLPLLFVQGERDKLAPFAAVEALVSRLPRASLTHIPTADHGFAVLKRSGLSASEAIDDIAMAIATWARGLA
jgi:predicted alpha/beta-hydrolase family hydrolase